MSVIDVEEILEGSRETTLMPHATGDNPYTGAPVSQAFMNRWRSKKHVGSSRPWFNVQIRRGRFERKWHYNWPNPQFGQVFGRSMRRQWYPDWTPVNSWVELPGVQKIDLDQSFDKNGITVATLDLDNVSWQQVTGPRGDLYHQRQRGWLWPWRGWRPADRPGSGDTPNQFYQGYPGDEGVMLPNAQILITQGYGSDVAVKTFTGLIDTFAPRVRPDVVTVTARDFGGVLLDQDLFGWNKDAHVNDPIIFMPHTHPFLKEAANDGKPHNWIVVRDVCDIVRCMLRWAGFKEWEIEDSGVTLSTTVTFDKSKSYMDAINAVKEQLGYVFFIAEPTSDDLSIGVPVFRRPAVIVQARSRPVASLRDGDMLTDIQPQHDNKDDRAIIRVRGVINNKKGRYLDNPAYGGDASSDIMKRITFQYWPPWLRSMSGVLKQLTYYNIGSTGVLGFTTVQQCEVACVLIAMQIALGQETATVQTPGNPAFGLDSYVYVTDAGTGIASRLYVTNRKSTMSIGGDGTAQQKSPYSSAGSSQSELLWATELGGSLVDNLVYEHVFKDYQRAITGHKVVTLAPGFGSGWD